MSLLTEGLEHKQRLNDTETHAVMLESLVIVINDLRKAIDEQALKIEALEDQLRWKLK